MKQVLSIFLLVIFQVNIAFAKCDWKNDIKRDGDSFVYTAQCHHEVGVLHKDIEDFNVEVTELRKTIDLKDLALVKADERVMNWRNESYNQFERLQSAYKWSGRSDKLHFLGGVGLTILAVWAAGQLK